MITKSIQLFEESGFSPQYSKPDPRGEEYGSFVATVTPRGPNMFKVSHTQECYEIYFRTALDFKNWSRSL